MTAGLNFEVSKISRAGTVQPLSSEKRHFFCLLPEQDSDEFKNANQQQTAFTVFLFFR